MLYVYLALLSAFGFSLSDITSKYLLNHGISSLRYLFWCHGLIYLFFVVLAMILAAKFSLNFLTNKDSYTQILTFPKGKLGALMIFATIVSLCSLISLLYAFKISDNIGYTSALVGTTAMITFLLSWLIFNKKPEPIGLIGAALIFTGVFLISKVKN